MKNLELIERKKTTENAKKSVIEFINSFDFSAYSDIRYVESKPFSLFYDINGHNRFHDKAYFEIGEKGFQIETYESQVGDTVRWNATWKNANSVFDGTCSYINFKELIASMEDFISKINAAVAVKETQIADFLEYVEGWKSYQETIRIAKEVEGKEEII
jgi:hypothetical protein